MTSATTLRIDPQFAAVWKELKPQERSFLEASLEAEGCRDALVVWGDVLVDGHNRYDFCTRFGIPFETRQIEFASHDEAMEWIKRNQRGRRNSTDEEIAYAIGKKYLVAKRRRGRPEQMGHDVPLNTAEAVGAEFGVSGKTVKRNAQFAKAVEKIADSVGPEAKAKILSGKSGRTKKEIVEIATLPAREQRKALAEESPPRRQQPAAFDIESAEDRLMDYGRRIIKSWPADQRERLAHWFKQLAKESLVVQRSESA